MLGLLLGSTLELSAQNVMVSTDSISILSLMEEVEKKVRDNFEKAFEKSLGDNEEIEETLEEYTYNPNIYNANNDNPIVEIELLKIAKVSKGNGTGLYKEYQLSSVGTYRANLTKGKNKIYYGEDKFPEEIQGISAVDHPLSSPGVHDAKSFQVQL